MPPATRICAACGERTDDLAAYCPHDGAPLVAEGDAALAFADPRLGVELTGGVRIERLAGVGASARVYRAHQAGVDRTVAVKVFAARATPDRARALERLPRSGLEKFHREARLASRIAHPNVVTVLLTGELPAAAGPAQGEPFAVLEWLDGPTLEAVLGAARASGEALDLVRALRIALGVADAAAAAHRAKILHRDLKPSNVVLVRRGDDPDTVKVLDFGLADLRADEGGAGGATTRTREGVVGTARYLAPEAARGDACAASDVHAVAAMLYECLAGRAPFEGTSAAAVLAARAGREPPDVREHARAAYVPAPIAALLQRALARDPARRPVDGAALSRDLLHAATASGLDAEDLLRRGEDGRPIRLPPQQRTRPHDPRVVATGARPRRT